MQLGPLLGLGQKGLDRGTGRAHVAGATILQIELEAAGGSHAGNGRRVEREDKASLMAANCAFSRFSTSKDRSEGSLRSSNGFNDANTTAELFWIWPSIRL